MDYTLIARVTLPDDLPGPGGLLRAARKALDEAGLKPAGMRATPITNEEEWRDWWNYGSW